MSTGDALSFREQWSSLSPLTLQTEEWADQTYAHPEAFWESLVALQQSLSPQPVRSVVGQGYDFYHDAVLRYVDSSVAFVVEEGDASTAWTYKKLHRCVTYQMNQWRKLRIKPGQVVVITLPKGPSYWVALCTALRMGLQVGFVLEGSDLISPTYGVALVRAMRPAWVITDKAESLWAQAGFPLLVIDTLSEEEDFPSPESYTYVPTEIMQKTLAFYRQTPYQVLPLDAQAVYLRALRDGLLSLRLQPGTCWSAPLCCPLRTEPSSSLMVFLCGATLIHIGDELLRQEPLRLKNHKIHQLGVSRALLKLWADVPACPKQLRSWYLSSFDRQTLPMQRFVQTNKLEKTSCFQVLMDPSLGGIVASSQPQVGEIDSFLRLSLGTPWTLQTESHLEQLSEQGYGWLHEGQSCASNGDSKNHLLFSRFEHRYLLIGATGPVREGVAVPLEKIESALRQLSFVMQAVVHTGPKIGELAHHYLVCILFVDPLKNDLPLTLLEQRSQEVRKAIEEQICKTFIPDRIEYFYMIPKFQQDTLDRQWCIQQYERGLLYKKSRRTVYQVLHALKAVTLELIKQ